MHYKNETINKNENILFSISKEPKKIHTVFEVNIILY